MKIEMTAEEALAAIPKSFWFRFARELINKFKTDIFAEDETSECDSGPALLFLESTYGWHDSFIKALRGMRCRKIRKWYEGLDWFHSDIFDDMVADRLMDWWRYEEAALTHKAIMIRYLIWSVTDGKEFVR